MPSSTDCGRDCAVTIEVTYPTTEGKFPLAIFSNGYNIDMRQYRNYAERFASWGYVGVRWNPKEGALGGVTQATRGKMAAVLVDWAFEETNNPRSVLYGKIDVTLGVVQSGHSLGGKTALLGAIDHPSVVGMVLFDPVDCPPPMPPGLPYSDDNPNAISMMNRTKAVGAFIGAELGDRGELIPCAPVECNYERYYGNDTSPAWQVMVVGAGHSQWTDNAGSGGPGGCFDGPQKAEIVHMVSHTAMIAWAEFAVYKKDITYWTTTWIQEMRNAGYVTYQYK
eukprot:CAMPEP_0196999424 /NCGR_PEP_ID=MMETSP1380-20130617/4607_1 /TAXON_ID=5936 /ORGANISM="Euplotes crassus, Strain CT5" /LENGTH=279 /DNA_ID=CAMNT_0042416345 /DNA_START=60 /DNA_END=899 /DNA_ORIENTATION=+